ncbi:MAG: WD_0033/WD_0034 family tandem repeat-containing protein [Wolbachia sp.]
MEAVSGNDLLEVLTIEDTIWITRDEKRTLILLGLAIYKNNNECIDAILTKAQNNGISQDILNDWRYILTPLSFAMYQDNNEDIGSFFLMQATNDGTLQNVFTSENIAQSLESWTYTLTPLGFAIHKGNNEYISSILIQAKSNGILQDVLAAVNTIQPLHNQYTFNTFELAEAINGSKASIKSILDDVSIPIQHTKSRRNSRA